MSMEWDGSRIMRLPEVIQYTKLGKSTIYRGLSKGTFPSPLRLGPRAVGWRARDVYDWLESLERRWEPTEGK